MSDHFIKSSSDPFASSSTSGSSAKVASKGADPSSFSSNTYASDVNDREKKGICPFCYTKQSLRAGSPCPNENCYSHRHGIGMPPEVITHELFPIAIVGASSSGKSHFLAVLKHTLVNEGFWGDGEENGYWKWAFVEYMNPANKDNASLDNPYIDYERKLYTEHRTIASTRRDDDHPPLLLSLDYLHPWKRLFDEPRFVKKSLLVAFTDTAGEHMQVDAIGSLKTNYPVLRAAVKGVIVMLDPKEERREHSDSANSVLAWFKGRDKKAPIPIALCITKIDELVRDGIPPEWLDERFNTNKSIPGRLALPDIENNSDAISEWMKGRDSLRATAEDFENSFRYHAFFTTSALGRDPFALDSDNKPVVDTSNGALVLKEGIPKPLRVLDPLLWILWEYGQLGGIKRLSQ